MGIRDIRIDRGRKIRGSRNIAVIREQGYQDSREGSIWGTGI